MAKKEQFKQLNTTIDNLLEDREKQIAKEYMNTLANVKMALAEVYEKYSDNDILTREEMVRYGRLAKLEEHLAEEIQKLTNVQVRITSNAIKDTFLESYNRYGYFIEGQVELRIYKKLSQEVIDQMLFNPLDAIKWSDRVKENSNGLLRQLKEVLTLGMIQGFSFSKMAKQVTEKFKIGLKKATRIVRTEGRRVQESANLKTMQDAEKNGVKMQKMWLSTLDTRTRDTHRHLDGQRVGVDEKFQSKSGFKALAPHMFGVPSEDINCRCTMISIASGIEPKVRRARDKDGKDTMIPYMTYEEWLKDLEER